MRHYFSNCQLIATVLSSSLCCVVQLLGCSLASHVRQALLIRLVPKVMAKIPGTQDFEIRRCLIALNALSLSFESFFLICLISFFAKDIGRSESSSCMIADFHFSFLVSPHFIARTAAPQPAVLPRSMGHHALSLVAPNLSLVQHTPLWPPKDSCFTFDRRPETVLVLLSCTKY
ncbi:hypothetical protein IWZ01DRAFT_488527 [Phyllosticta capitalensis]